MEAERIGNYGLRKHLKVSVAKIRESLTKDYSNRNASIGLRRDALLAG